MAHAWSHPRWAATGLAAPLLAAALLAGGCRRAPPDNTVSGTVTFEGQPVPLGFVQFFREGELVGHAPLRWDGSYEMRGLTVGEVQVCVVTDVPPDAPAPVLPGPPPPGGFPPGVVPPGVPPPPGPAEKGPEPEGPLPPPGVPQDVRERLDRIHKNYGDPEAPRLTYTVRPGPQVHDLALK